MSQKPVKAFLQIPRVRMECGIGCLGYQTVHQVRISHCHGSHKYTSVYYRSAHRYQSLPSGKPYVFLLEREVEGIDCNHCMKLMSILGEIGICYILEEGGCTRGWGAGLPEVLVYPRAVGYTRGWLGVPEGKVGGGYGYPPTTWTLDLGYSLPHLL